MIDFKRQLVRVQDPSGRELVIHGEKALDGPSLCSAVTAKRLLQQGSTGFLDYVSDTRVEATPDMSRVPIVRYFTDVFPEELPGVTPKRNMEFRIDLVHGAGPIAKAPYRLALPEM